MGRPRKKQADQQPQRCQSCTTRLKTGTAIYHTGPVGKNCEKAKKKDTSAKKNTDQTPAVAVTTRSKARTGSPASQSTSPKGGSPAMRKELNELKKQLDALSKLQPKSHQSKSRKRKRDPSPVEVSSGDEIDSEFSESEYSQMSSPDPSPPKAKRSHKLAPRRQKHLDDYRGRASRSNPEKTRRRRERAPSRHSKDSSEDEYEPRYITTGLLAALPGLASTSAAKSKSGEHRTAADRAPAAIKWPHEWIRSPNPNSSINPHNITLAQFVRGFMECVDHAGVANGPYMLAHLKTSMRDIDIYGWETVRQLELILFQQLESGETTWPRTKGMEWFQTKMGLFGAAGPLIRPSAQHVSAQTGSTSARKSKVNPCPDFQLGNCQKSRDHDGLKHVCAYHYNALGGKHLFPHGEVDCKLKSSHTEAGEGAASAEN